MESVLAGGGVLMLGAWQAEQLYKRALEADRKHLRSICNFATLCAQRGDTEQADKLFRSAMEAEEPDAFALCSFANFVWNRKKHVDEVCAISCPSPSLSMLT
jgi:Tfp pilus assembly protein PilF